MKDSGSTPPDVEKAIEATQASRSLDPQEGRLPMIDYVAAVVAGSKSQQKKELAHAMGWS